MKFVLVLIVLAGSYDGGVSTLKIEGFRSLQACQAAAAMPKRLPNYGSYAIVDAYCLEVK